MSNEAYQAAMAQIHARCEAYKADHGEYPIRLEVDAETWEQLRAGIHASRDATHFQLPVVEDVPARTQSPSTFQPLHMVTIMKAVG